MKNHDSRTSRRDDGSNGKQSPNLLLYFWSNCCLYFGICLLSVWNLNAQTPSAFNPQPYTGNPLTPPAFDPIPYGEPGSSADRAQFSSGVTSGTFFLTIPIRIHNHAPFGMIVQFSGVNILIQAGSSRLLGDLNCAFPYSSLSPGGGPQYGNVTTSSAAFSWYKSGESSANAGNKTIPANIVGVILYGKTSPPFRASNALPEIALHIDSKGVGTINNPLVPNLPQDELMMMLYNNTGVAQRIMWGDKEIILNPGLNQFRYDGPVLPNGLPTVKPGDFLGTAITGPDGTKYVIGELQKPVGGEGVYWTTNPVPHPSSPTNDRDSVEILGPTVPGGPGTAIIRGSDGKNEVLLIPPTPPRTPPSTNGQGGAVISDPTQPKPPQTLSNTVSNTTNNNTSNTTINNTTIINNDGKDAKGDAAAVAALNGMGTRTDTPTGDGAGTPRGGTASGGLTDGLSKSRNASVSKLAKFDFFSNAAVPKIMSFPISINLGQFGTISRNIDFTQNPFPAVRAAMVVMLTLMFGMAFMKRVTI